MKRILVSILLTMGFVLCVSAQEKEYQLVWSDEFDVDGKPSTDWSYESGFVRNEELQWYQRDNAYVKDGCLVIEGRKECFINPHYEASSSDWRKNREFIHYTSSSLTTQFSQQFLYGRFEIRAKIPVASGAWPAIWLQGNKWYFTEKDPYWADKFHIWRMDWDKAFIRIYLDNELLNEIDLSKTQNQGCDGNTENPFANDVVGFKHYLLLNLAIGSNGGKPDDSQFPLRYYIDYVRVYQ